MKRYWRIANKRYALDKSCEGNRLVGGRWNKPGYGALYAAETIELASLEKFVHTAGIAPADLVLVAVDVPDAPGLTRRVEPAELPADWNGLPASDAAQDFGSQWLAKAAELVLLVPSVIVPESRNAVINPLHPRYAEVALSVVRDFRFDPRMYGAGH
ncbi:RES domain-containing protein [Sulfuritortus calidifontis]|uniref:RES domain-containing protein n=1 Tax=Sulfuritortus calidifontis TaxID=1914471 RepID=A0A4R3JX84_9PROT|nr:RES family NAD+ phosphorylase [Sulfuritortus calidifontis]TCS72925.1 RES domain-containing protein [Sulfuritortus calidifontis]